MMRTRVIGVAAILLSMALATLTGFAVGYREIEPGFVASTDNLAEDPSAQGAFKVLLAITLFTAIAGSLVGSTICLLLLRSQMST
jgi:hypothetical protein